MIFLPTKLLFSLRFNFPFYSLEEKNKTRASWTRKEWAFATHGRPIHSSRVHADVQQHVSQTITAAVAYISVYNI
jgi:hypothetical protein